MSRVPLIEAITAYLEKAEEDLAYMLEDAGFVNADEMAEDIFTLEDEIVEALEAETRYFVDDVLRYNDLQAYKRDRLDAVKEGNPTAAALRGIFTAAFGSMLLRLTASYVSEVDPDLTVHKLTYRTEAAKDTLPEWLGMVMTETSNAEFERSLNNAIDAAKNVYEFVSGLQDGREWLRARRVAEDEVMRMHSFAQMEAEIQCPAITGRRWVHNWPENPRENHEAMDGQIALEKEPFELVGTDGHTYHPIFPRDPSLPASEVIRCHCNTKPVISEEMLALPLDDRRRLQREAVEEEDEHWLRQVDRERSRAAGL